MRAAVLLSLLPVPALSEGIPLPSGGAAELQESFWQDDAEMDGDWLRLRFVSPVLGSWEVAAADLEYLCEMVALPLLTESGRSADVIMVSLADRPSEFGQSDPDLVQFIEAFRPGDGVCTLEGY